MAHLHETPQERPHFGVSLPTKTRRHASLARAPRARREAQSSKLAMGQNPNRTPSEHPNPTTKIGCKMGGEFTYPKMVPLVLTHSQMFVPWVWYFKGQGTY